MQFQFLGSTPYILEAAEEIGAIVQPHRVQKIAAIRTLAVLASQIGTHPDPAVLIEHAAEHVDELRVALSSALKMVEAIKAAVPNASHAPEPAPAVPTPSETVPAAPQTKSKK